MTFTKEDLDNIIREAREAVKVKQSMLFMKINNIHERTMTATQSQVNP